MKRILLLLLFLYAGFSASTQNLYDHRHSLDYAGYLYRSGEYGLAVREYERLVFLDSANKELPFRLLRSYRKSREYAQGVLRAGQLFPDPMEMDSSVSGEYALLLVQEKRYRDAIQFVQSVRSIDPGKKDIVLVSSWLFLQDYPKALEQYHGMTVTGPALSTLKQIATEAASMDLKHHGLALALSAAVPGLGKAYAGTWKDGLLSFIFTGAAIYQSYRGFDNHGSWSGYGWIFGGLAAGFLLGNLYGTW
jgi:tetratricopeptide (TPR) repeat protein